jgi:hypothetical protein
MGSRSCASRWRSVSYTYHLQSVLALRKLAALAARMDEHVGRPQHAKSFLLRPAVIT